MTVLQVDPLQSALCDWAEEAGAREIVRLSPALLRLKSRLAREEARRAKVKCLQRGTLFLVSFLGLGSALWFYLNGSLELKSLTLGGLSSLFPLLMAPLIFTVSVVGLMED